MHIDPVTDDQWQDAATEAEAGLRMEAAIRYGLWNREASSGALVANEARCHEILERAARKGIAPNEGRVREGVRGLQARSMAKGT